MASTRSSYNINNQAARKLKTEELRKLAYDDYCNWIAAGKSHKAWRFEHNDLLLSWQSMERNLKEYPNEFNPLHKEIAMAKSLELWENRGEGLIETQDRCQPAIYQMFMRNKFGWDKESVEEKIDKAKEERTQLQLLVEEIRKPKEV